MHVLFLIGGKKLGKKEEHEQKLEAGNAGCTLRQESGQGTEAQFVEERSGKKGNRGSEIMAGALDLLCRQQRYPQSFKRKTEQWF